MMYQAPTLFGAKNSLIPVSQDIILILEEECTFYNIPCNEDMNTLCNNVILENNLNSKCYDPYDAVKLYLNLRKSIYEIIGM